MHTHTHTNTHTHTHTHTHQLYTHVHTRTYITCFLLFHWQYMLCCTSTLLPEELGVSGLLVSGSSLIQDRSIFFFQYWALMCPQVCWVQSNMAAHNLHAHLTHRYCHVHHLSLLSLCTCVMRVEMYGHLEYAGGWGVNPLIPSQEGGELTLWYHHRRVGVTL